MNQVYVYRVRDHQGRVHKGEIAADSERLVISKLREQGFFVTSVNAKAQAVDVRELWSRWVGPGVKELVIFSRQFATMIGAGLPILRCLDILTKQTTDPGLRAATLEIKRDVEAGASLSGAMGRYPKVFPELFVTMVRAGEVGGILDTTLNRLAEHYEREEELREKVKTATRYPLVVMFFAVAVVIFMLATVVPTFAGMFHSMHAELPLPTQLLLGLSSFVSKYILVVLAGLLAGSYGLYKYLGTPEGRKASSRFIKKLPVFGELSMKINVARVSRTLGTLLSSGVPILQALDVVKTISSDWGIREGLTKAWENIREGEGMAAPLEATGEFPPMVTQMIAVGEETGNVDGMLSKVADYYEREVKNTTDRLGSLIEPFLIIFLAFVVGGIIFSTILPIFTLYGKIG